jgi:hypothetical protein
MDMIEKVASALAVYGGYDIPALKANRYHDPEGTWEYHTGLARAAIEAMREPTEAMLDVRPFGLSVTNARETWGAMMSAALGKGE